MHRPVLAAIAAAAAFMGLTQGALAADLYSPPPSRQPATVIETLPYSWTGFYIGGNLGGAWADTNLTEVASGLKWGGNQNQFTGGGQVGFNYQVSNIVLGIEGGFNWAAIDANSAAFAIPAGTFQASVETDWIGTLAGRFGIAADNWLFYGKAGGAWVQGTGRVTNVVSGASTSSTNTASGWLLGGGIEYAFNRNWSARVEYDYIALSDRTLHGPAGLTTVRVENDLQLLTVGINYKF